MNPVVVSNKTVNDYQLQRLNRFEELMGTWVSINPKGDTLIFLSENKMVRKYHTKTEFICKLYGDELILRIFKGNFTTETRHKIIEFDGNELKLSNMYRGHINTNNTGLYKKID
jgi:hypothetical protein